MTDERQGNELWDALHALPRGAGVIVRHYALSPAARKAMFARIRSVARARGLMLILAGPPQLARAWHADGFHGRRPGHAYPELLHTAPAHDLPELRNAARNGAGLVLLSPVHATRSHPGATPLGPLRFGMIARQTQLKVVALGGMNARRARAIRTLNSYGWAGIDGLTPAGRIRI
ncbi:thiamine phosphate synthase [Sphingobium boeckii]|uniref:Thiamine-phosphate pyrophosphorylase n=1 Tax=Sphingobium boeckii TaxID=1082345 RepID=A0A7W9ECC0_9SPHN|nr:thiamine phosphate synthase [Sphingobium boeckii]MBB5684108.1 thiamine-phosphate pyrophosphorylase [Sphingobium boeckii]